MLKPDVLATLFENSTLEVMIDNYRVDNIVFEFIVDPSLIKLTVALNGGKHGVFSYKEGDEIYVPDSSNASMLAQVYKLKYFEYNDVQNIEADSNQIINGYDNLSARIAETTLEIEKEFELNTNIQYSTDELGYMINTTSGRQLIL
jgi:hypothetical protein